MKKLITLFFVAALIFSTIDSKANGLSLNSPGPKGLGMGGAMIGLADDYTALYWNPAGITNLQKTQIGVYFTGIMPAGTYKVAAANIDAKTESNIYPAPGLFAYTPLVKGDLVVGLGVYVPAGLGAEWNGDDLKLVSNNQSFKWSNQIGAINFAPGVAYRVLGDMLSVGATFNLVYGMLDMERPRFVAQANNFFQYSESSTGMGYGVTVGALFKPIDMLSVGLSFKSETKVAMEGDAEYSVMPNKSKFERDLSWPMWIGGGIAVTPTDNLTICLDAQWSNWSETQNEIITTYTDWQMTEPMHLKWEDALQIRFGAQYDLEILKLRAGFYTDPAPSPDETLNIVFPSISYTGLTLGAGLEFGNIGVDVGLEYLIGSERNITTQTADNMSGIHNMNIFAGSFGVVYFLGENK